MRLHHALFLLLLIAPTLAWSYELLTIQAVSDTKKTFITRNGQRQGITRGLQATFTAEDVSILARALNVTGEFTQWQIVNQDAIVPFEKGAIVTWSAAKEYLWALAPEKERQKYIKSRIVLPRKSFSFKGAFTRGISESVSGVVESSKTRGGYLGEFSFERPFSRSLAVDVGFRHEREIINYTGVSFNTRRSMLIGNLLYYFEDFTDLLNEGRLFIGLGFGYGNSSTVSNALTQSGPVTLVPAVKFGLSLPFNEDWDFLVDTAFETLQTKEEAKGGLEQSTTQSNFKAGFGLRKFY